MSRRRRGQAMVEFALVFPIVILILMGLFDFGRAIVAYNTVAEAARNGARVAIVNQIPADICSVAAGRAVGLGLPSTCAASPAAVGIYVTPSCSAINCQQSVKATYQFRAITPIIGAFIGPITLSATSSLLVESTCTSAPCPTT